jgi:hypothetical protein
MAEYFVWTGIFGISGMPGSLYCVFCTLWYIFAQSDTIFVPFRFEPGLVVSPGGIRPANATNPIYLSQ